MWLPSAHSHRWPRTASGKLWCTGRRTSRSDSKFGSEVPGLEFGEHEPLVCPIISVGAIYLLPGPLSFLLM